MSAVRYRIEELERQTQALAGDLPRLLRAAAAQAATLAAGTPCPERVVALGSGDSLNAALSCAPAFAAVGSCEYWALSAMEFLGHPPSRALPPERITVVGVSASGGNPSLVNAVTAAGDAGCRTLAVTTVADSPLARAAAATLCVPLGPLDPCPGIRTFQASLIALLQLAPHLLGTAAHPRAHGLPAHGLPAHGLPAQSLAESVARSVELAAPHVPDLVQALADAPMVLVVGSGPGLGTARHIAAKITEGAGVPAAGVEIEDWWHVHRFGHDRRHPALFVATPGPARGGVLWMARRTAERRPVVLVAAEDDQEAVDVGGRIVPVAAGVPDVLRPVTDHVVAGLLAAGLARRLGTVPFATP